MKVVSMDIKKLPEGVVIEGMEEGLRKIARDVRGTLGIDKNFAARLQQQNTNGNGINL